ncbi:MAG: hypothetical protein R2941_02490 [Desulfobacterales bacterium]
MNQIQHMKKEDRDNLYKLFRNYEDILGPDPTAVVALESFIQAVEELKCSESEITSLLMELSEVIKDTRPRIIPLIHLTEQFEAEISPHFGKSLEEIKTQAVRILREKIAVFESYRAKLIENGMKYVEDKDVIVVHSISYAVERILIQAHQTLGKKFRVLLLKQDFTKTGRLIKSLSNAGIELFIIPEFNLSQYLENISKLFIGAMSVTSDRKVVAAVGTAGIVSLCHLNKVPVYLFVNSLKFSHQPYAKQGIHRKNEDRQDKDLSYSLTTCSHDVVDLDLVTHVITEQSNGQSP